MALATNPALAAGRPKALASTSNVVVEPAIPPASQPVNAPASAPTATSVSGSSRYSCVLGEHGGVDDDEARTGVDVVCAELAKQRAPEGEYEIRFGKLGSRQIFTLVQRSTGEERQLAITGMDEILVAAPRVVTALSKSSNVAATSDVANVTQSEARTPPLKPAAKSFTMGIAGTTAAGVDFGLSGGVSMRLAFRFAQTAVVMDGRAGGIGSGDNELGYADVGVGGRYYLSNEDVSPFVAGGLALSYFQANRGNGEITLSGSGLGAYAEVGVELFRTTRNGFVALLRADFPTFSLKGTEYEFNGPVSDSRYVVPLSLDIGLVFN
jgi:hypothetical protein